MIIKGNNNNTSNGQQKHKDDTAADMITLNMLRVLCMRAMLYGHIHGVHASRFWSTPAHAAIQNPPCLHRSQIRRCLADC